MYARRDKKKTTDGIRKARPNKRMAYETEDVINARPDKRMT